MRHQQKNDPDAHGPAGLECAAWPKQQTLCLNLNGGKRELSPNVVLGHVCGHTQTQVHAVIINNEIRFKLLKKKHNANFKTSKIDLLLSANSSQLALTYITNMLWVYICGYDA